MSGADLLGVAAGPGEDDHVGAPGLLLQEVPLAGGGQFDRQAVHRRQHRVQPRHLVSARAGQLAGDRARARDDGPGARSGA
ncbi:hypothetical protein [Kitasatospora cathayae]|uniref:Uncharacterized protein n=1 Tax=Kitasatospora cathayae TaxID=3004092 RepID=A0ABY7PWL5_9ACTN|nr:hypothetical protein [Kitasatospora sp. HUAS 3-15]WBP84766.1 hypothetical protein O1G21_02145 [Kitasatospora sp. HUAS 3-15]